MGVLTAIGNFIYSIVEFIITFIGEAFYILGNLIEILTYLPDLFGWLPFGVSQIVLLAFIISVVFKIFGREG